MSADAFAPDSSGTTSCPQCGAVYVGLKRVCDRCGATIRQPQGEYPPGAVIDDKYEVLSLLGVGGMGEVYKTRHRHLNSFRCIKVMRNNLLADETFRMRFVREARVATQIQHPNIAVLHDFAPLPNGSYYMVWEFIDGTSIRQWASSHGRFPLDVAVDIAIQVLAGLDHCHRRGLLHRDISPDNIMIANDDEDLIVKIIDLGIAKQVSSPQSENTQVGLFVGNPKYSSPEQLGGFEEGEAIDGRTDLYSLGVVLYEMLLGVPLFQSRTPQGYVVKHLTQPPPAFSEVDPSFQSHHLLEKIVLKALEKDRANRWASAREFALALYRFQRERSAEIGVDITNAGTQRSRKLMLEVPKVTVQQVPVDSSQTVVKSVAARESEDQQAWQRASDRHTLDGYREFLTLFPESERASQAKARIERLLLDTIDALETRGDLAALEQMAREHPPDSRIGGAADRALARLGPPQPVQPVAPTIEAPAPPPLSLQAAIPSETSETDDWAAALQKSTVEGWKTFISTHPASIRVIEARHNLEESMLFEAAAEENSIDAWRQYLMINPTGIHAPQAQARLDGILAEAEERKAYDLAISSYGEADLRDYVARYPNSPRAGDARRALEELSDLAAARAGDEESVWNAFLERWGGGRHAAEAQTRVQQLRDERSAYEVAAVSAESEGLREFLSRHPNSKRARRAQELLDEALAWERIQHTTVIGEVDRFLDLFPTGAHATRARELRRSLQEVEEFRNAQEAHSAAVWRKFLADHPGNGERQQEARGHLEVMEHAACRAALESRSIDHLKVFLDEFPDGRRSGEARSMLRALQADKDAAEFLASDGSPEAARAVLAFDADAITALIARAEEQEKIEHLLTLGKRADLKALRKQADDARARIGQRQRRREVEMIDWDAAEVAGTSSRWRAFTEKHPDSPRIDEARKRLDNAREAEYMAANASIDTLRAYLARTTDPRQRAEAESRLAELEREAADASAGRRRPAEGFASLPLAATPAMKVPEPAVTPDEPPPAPPEPPLRGGDTIETLDDESSTMNLRPNRRQPPPEMAPVAAATDVVPLAISEPVEDIDVGPVRSEVVAAEPVPTPVVTVLPRAIVHTPKPRRVARVYYAIPIVIGVLVLALGGLFAFIVIKGKEAPVPPEQLPMRNSSLVVDARPWAEVTAVQSQGRNYLKSAVVTPYVVKDLPPGDYEVTFRDPRTRAEKKVQTRVLEVGPGFAEVQFERVDVGNYLQEAGWR